MTMERQNTSVLRKTFSETVSLYGIFKSNPKSLVKIIVKTPIILPNLNVKKKYQKHQQIPQ